SRRCMACHRSARAGARRRSRTSGETAVSDGKTIVIGADQGTTNTKAVAVDSTGRVLHRATRPIATQAPRDGWAEQDPEEMFASVAGCVREVLAASGRRAGDVAGIGIANQTETLVVWERATGRPVMAAIVWQCRRGEAELRDLREDGVAAMVHGRTGLDL